MTLKNIMNLITCFAMSAVLTMFLMTMGASEIQCYVVAFAVGLLWSFISPLSL
jgi:hypothetical protein